MKIINLLILTCLISACAQQEAKQKTPTLKVNYITYSEAAKTDSVVTYTQPNIILLFSQLAADNKYVAVNKSSYMQEVCVSDSIGVPMRFETKNDFLNHMHNNGYKLTQDKPDGIIFTKIE